MNGEKVKTFMQLGGQRIGEFCDDTDEERRKLGAQLLLSEVLEYVIYGLGVTPKFQGVTITEPDALQYEVVRPAPDKEQMLDGLSDVAYTMYWNALAFGLPLEDTFDAVCDNNLEKFVLLENWSDTERELSESEWDCGKGVSWPTEVARVQVINIQDKHYAVGKDARGKVRKPAHFRPVDLSSYVELIP